VGMLLREHPLYRSSMELTPSHLSLARDTMSQGIESLMTSGSPFSAIAMVEKDNARRLVRFIHERAEGSAEAARRFCTTQDDADSVAFAIDAFITYQGARSDAIVVECWDHRTETVSRQALRYATTGMFRKKPFLVGTPLELTPEGWVPADDTTG